MQLESLVSGLGIFTLLFQNMASKTRKNTGLILETVPS